MSSEKTAAELALDKIAEICGCPEWEYPGQIVRDVEALKKERDVAELKAAQARNSLDMLTRSMVGRRKRGSHF